MADFIGNVNLFDGTLEEDESDHCVIGTPHGRFYIGHGITGVVGQAVSVALRPEKIELQQQAPSDTRFNCLHGRVAERAYFGASSLYRVQLDQMPPGDQGGDQSPGAFEQVCCLLIGPRARDHVTGGSVYVGLHRSCDASQRTILRGEVCKRPA